MKPGKNFPSKPLLQTGMIMLLIPGGLLAAFLILQSGRHGSGTLIANQAWAEEQPARLQTSKTAAPVDEDEPETDSLIVFPKDRMASWAESLKDKERELAAREKALKEEKQQLEALRIEVEQKLDRIEKVRKEMDQLTVQAEQQRKKELGKWVDIYQSMSPQKAGEVIQGLEPKFALELLAQMEPKKAGKILSFVAPDKAIELGKKLDTKRP